VDTRRVRERTSLLIEQHKKKILSLWKGTIN
jgi:hypothetical protein